MVNYLRSRRMKEISVLRDAESLRKATNECPHCKSRSLEAHGKSKFCRNCHRYLENTHD